MPVDFYKLWTVFATTCRASLLVFGGDRGMVPVMRREFVHRQHWVDESDILDSFEASHSLPGATVINSSIMLGYRVAGTFGGILAAFGSTLLPVFLFTLVTAVYSQIGGNPYVLGFMRGVGGVVAALLLNAALTLFRQSVKDAAGFVLFLLAAALTLFRVISPLLLIASGGIFGLLYSLFLKIREGRRAA